MDGIEIKEGQIGIFSVDGGFLVRVKDGKTHVIPKTPCCFDHENDPRAKRFHHDCEECVYLGQFTFTYDSGRERFDAYYCEIIPEFPTVIARYGNEGHQCLSGLGFSGVLEDIENYAKSLGLLKIEPS